jgi:pimeloyl-ACP methyl ester carboxylesterase
MELFADDIYEIICFNKWEIVDIFGVSFGGRIAQKFALNYSKYLNKLILGCTSTFITPKLKDCIVLYQFFNILIFKFKI